MKHKNPKKPKQVVQGPKGKLQGHNGFKGPLNGFKPGMIPPKKKGSK